MPEKTKTPVGIRRTEVGSSGLRWAYPGYVEDEFLIQLRGTRGIKIYREMSDNDPIIGACLYAIRQILREVRWTVKPADSNKKLKDDEDALFLEECMRNMTHTWSDFISEIMSMFPYGWAFFEQVFKLRRKDGKVVWKKLPIRTQNSLEHWEMLDNGDTVGLWQRPAPSYQLRYIRLEGKGILFRTESRGNNPEGRSILRNSYRPWYMKKNFEEIEGIGVERNLVGVATMTMPEGLKMDDDAPETKEAIDWAKKIVTNMRRDEQDGLLLPHGWEFALVASPGTNQIDTSAIISRYAKEIAISVLAQFVMLGMERTGSYALGKELIDMFYMSLESFADYIASAFNKQAVTTLFGLNKVFDRPLPYIVHTPVRRQAIADMAKYVASLLKEDAIVLDDDLKSYLKRYARLTEYSEERK